MGKMTPPNNGREVLTWVQDANGLEHWQIDRYVSGFWHEGNRWQQKVLYWQELPPPPQLEVNL